jgi:signal transduction histidine kinase
MLGGPHVLLIATIGPRAEALATPVGRAAVALASWWTPAPSALVAGSDRRELTGTLMLAAAIAALLAFCGATWRAMRRPAPRHPGFLLALQAALTVCCDTNLGYVLAAQIGFRFPARRALYLSAAVALLSGAVELALVAMPLMRSDFQFSIAVLLAGLECALKVGVTALGCAAIRERQARLALAAANAELHATHALLAQTVRSNERQRIARDVHDVLGHHLTALKLHLDLALRQAGASAPAPLGTASEVAASLLAEVRQLVGEERAADPIDLRSALEMLCARIPAPRIALAMDPAIAIDSPATVHALFCCIQEAVSNAMRHADATALAIRLVRNAAGDLTIDIADDGHGSAGAAHGNGLRGMAERLAQLGGSLRTMDGPHAGFTLQLFVPAAGGAL